MRHRYKSKTSDPEHRRLRANVAAAWWRSRRDPYTLVHWWDDKWGYRWLPANFVYMLTRSKLFVYEAQMGDTSPTRSE